MKREELLDMIRRELAKLSEEQKDELLVVMQIEKGEAPTNLAAVLRVKRTVMEMQKEGYPVGDALLRYFTG